MNPGPALEGQLGRRSDTNAGEPNDPAAADYDLAYGPPDPHAPRFFYPHPTR